MQELPSLFEVFWFASLTAVATGIGALPFFFIRELPRFWLGVANALAAGLMLAASFSLIYEGAEYGMFRVVLGVLAGLVFITVSERLLPDDDSLSFGKIHGADARRMLLILGVMTVHSVAEGVGVGVSFGGGAALGIYITIAIAIHNIPEGLAISLVAVPRGMRPIAAVGWSIVSSLPQPLMAVPAFAFVAVFQPFLPVGLGFAAGAMIWMVFAELIHEAAEDSSPGVTGIVVTLAVALMLVLQLLVKG
jgi:zinc transporter ZupT